MKLSEKAAVNNSKNENGGRLTKETIIQWMILLLLIALFLTQHLIYVQKDQVFDSDGHFLRAVRYYNVLFKGITDREFRHMPFPPLVYLVTTSLFRLSSISLFTAKLVNVIFGLVFILSMFGIGRITGGPWTGLAVAAVAASSPHLLNVMHSYYLDFPQTAMTALAFLMLLRAEKSKNLIDSILFGTALGLALLTKWSSLFFLAVPVLWLFLSNVKNIKKSFIALVSIAAASAVSGFVFNWYVRNVPGKLDSLIWIKYSAIGVVLPWALLLAASLYFRKKTEETKGQENPNESAAANHTAGLSLAVLISAPWYFFAAEAVHTKFFIESDVIKNYAQNSEIMFYFLLTLFSFGPILILGGTIISLIGSQNRKYIFLLLAFAVSASVILVLIGYPQPRYILSLLIFLTPLILCFRTSKRRWFFSIYTVLILLLSFVTLGAGILFPGGNRYVRQTHSIMIEHNRKRSYTLLIPTAPFKHGYDFSRVFTDITPADKKETVMVIFDNKSNPPFEEEKLIWQAMQQGFNLKVWRRKRNTVNDQLAEFRKDSAYQKDLFDINYVLLFHRLKDNPESATEQIGQFFAQNCKRTTFDVGQDDAVTLIKLLPPKGRVSRIGED